MSDAVIVSLVIGGAGLSITIAGIVFSHGVIRGKQEAESETNKQFRDEVRAKLNGLPTKVAALESNHHDLGNRMVRHHVEIEQKLDKLDERLRQR